MSKMPKEQFDKSLARLESLSKAQLHHTPQSSRVSEWAGSREQDQNEHEDGIDDGGTDYTGVRKSLANKMSKGGQLTPAEVAIYNGQDPRAYIADKVTKGESLTSAETWAIKGGMAQMGEDMDAMKSTGKAKPGPAGTPGEDDSATSVEHTNAGSKEDEIEQDAKKSLESELSKSQTVQQGIEMSPFLYEFVRGVGEALRGTEARVQKSVAAALAPIVTRTAQLEKSLHEFAQGQHEFNKSLADGVIAIGHQVSGSAELVNAQASSAARAPMSQLRSVPTQGGAPGVTAVAKSFGGQGGPDLNKAQIVDTMFEMVKSQKLQPQEVIKFESTGQMTPQVEEQVRAFYAGAGR